MTAAPARPRLVGLSRSDFADRLTDAIDVYVTAMGYPRSTARQRRSLWLEHSYRPGWRSVGWVDERNRLRGIGYGYWGGPGQWWFEEVRRGLRARRGDPDGVGPDWLTDYFELTELHVHPRAQGTGIGESLLRALARDAARSRMLLSTPEYGPEPPGRAWRLYRRAGFRDVLREHLFTGDPRPFAVLGRELPLAPSGPATTHPGHDPE
ncbi:MULTISPECIES: GNAT family N-acetyltransferase [Pseudonocardia]|uniref:Acetyltransferase (GNAT) family protein n=2 Tax=Pseudonocardia TaxID=1847 RepID=A0A1Y2MQR2_PSEAH|nr:MULTISPECIES: GNAT family N-acetyltransferase [Pseudonocardia]OSY37309.1 Acetyltransferase (GNAT) family protein [Pseudonocardia autotrophica]TDN72394.1 acetyltransferase (GNAT) family protein [Pseudonocardia autotrophica]BBG03102.1 acetyltransferase [Pseudonocardia autotrophica]GEC23722.1 acetyltransferase [Pseudonocardia saturnea]